VGSRTATGRAVRTDVVSPMVTMRATMTVMCHMGQTVAMTTAV